MPTAEQARRTVSRLRRAVVARMNAVLAAVAAALVLAACGPPVAPVATPDPAAAPHADTFTLTEFRIVPAATTLQAGPAAITARNVGHLRHELVIVHGDDPSAVPTRPDGSVDEDRIASVKVGEISDLAPGAVATETFALTPGSYIVFCNLIGMSGGMMGGGGGMMGGQGEQMGHAHFWLGMAATFSVG